MLGNFIPLSMQRLFQFILVTKNALCLFSEQSNVLLLGNYNICTMSLWVLFAVRAKPARYPQRCHPCISQWCLREDRILLWEKKEHKKTKWCIMGFKSSSSAIEATVLQNPNYYPLLHWIPFTFNRPWSSSCFRAHRKSYCWLQYFSFQLPTYSF